MLTISIKDASSLKPSAETLVRLYYPLLVTHWHCRMTMWDAEMFYAGTIATQICLILVQFQHLLSKVASPLDASRTVVIDYESLLALQDGITL